MALRYSSLRSEAISRTPGLEMYGANFMSTVIPISRITRSTSSGFFGSKDSPASARSIAHPVQFDWHSAVLSFGQFYHFSGILSECAFKSGRRGAVIGWRHCRADSGLTLLIRLFGQLSFFVSAASDISRELLKNLRSRSNYKDKKNHDD
jgi:hypothetical protein